MFRKFRNLNKRQRVKSILIGVFVLGFIGLGIYGYFAGWIKFRAETPECTGKICNTATLTYSDAQGTHTVTSNTVVVTLIQADTVAPQVTLTGIPGLAKGTISITVNATDNIGIAKIDLLLDNVIVGTATSSPYIHELDTTKFSQGINSLHKITAKAYDAANNIGLVNSKLRVYNPLTLTPTPPLE